MLSHGDLSSGTNQRLPLPIAQLAREQHLDLALQEVVGSRIPRTEGLSTEAGAVAEQSGRKDPAIVYNQQVIRLEQFGKFCKFPVLVLAAGSPQVEHAGGAPLGQRLLSN